MFKILVYLNVKNLKVIQNAHALYIMYTHMNMHTYMHTQRLYQPYTGTHVYRPM
jgi:hypothetical protein